jgi:hypothetical protein
VETPHIYNKKAPTMKISSNSVTLFSILFALLVLVACGSGGGGTDTNVTPPVVDPDPESQALLMPVANDSELLVSV